MLRSYSLAPETIRRFLRRMVWRFQIIAALSFLAFGLYLAFLARPIDWSAAAPLVGLIVLIYFAIIFYNFRQQLRLLYSERFELDDGSITYRQGKKPPLHISRSDIIRVQERSDGIVIETSRQSTRLLIPYGLAREGDVDFRTTLQTWATIQTTPRQRGA